jgi:hypothetical protein
MLGNSSALFAIDDVEHGLTVGMPLLLILSRSVKHKPCIYLIGASEIVVNTSTLPR